MFSDISKLILRQVLHCEIPSFKYLILSPQLVHLFLTNLLFNWTYLLYDFCFFNVLLLSTLSQIIEIFFY